MSDGEEASSSQPPEAPAHTGPLTIKDLEDPGVTRARQRSLFIVHVSMFIFSLGFSIILTGVLPYMEQLDDTKGDGLLLWYGAAVAANPLGQMVFSPVFGAIANKMKSVRLICLISAIVYIVGNILYASLSIFPINARIPLLLVSRFVVGVSSANVAPLRSYVSQSTFLEERTKHVSYVSAAQSVGFIVGPSIQACLTPLKCTEKDHSSTYLDFDMYTGAGWISAIFGVAALILFLPAIFQEFDVQDKAKQIAASRANPDSEKPRQDANQLPPLDMPVIIVLLFCFFVYFINFVILEALGTPMVMDEYSWSESETVLYLGIIMTIGGIIAMVCFISVGPLSARFDERKLLVFLGVIPLMLARILMFPIGNGKINYIKPNDTDSLVFSSRSMMHPVDPRTAPLPYNIPCGDESEEDGCEFEWCETQTQLNFYQFLIGYLLVFVFYPYCIALTQSIYSKVLGPRPQGTWMGYLTASGSLARVCGPLFVTFVYNIYGLYVTFAIVEVVMAISLVLTFIYYKRLVPISQQGETRSGGNMTQPVTMLSATRRRDDDMVNPTTSF